MDRRLGIAFFVALAIVLLLVFSTKRQQPDPISASAASQDSSSICLHGCPTGAPLQDQIVAHHILILANNPRTKFADWVAYRITRDTLGSQCKRRWERDPDISPDNTLEPSDYFGIKKALDSDRGHQAPLASLCGSPYWNEADYLSNITPQKSILNEGT